MFVNTVKGIIKLKYKMPVKLQGQNFPQGEIANNISIPLLSKDTGIFLSGSIGTTIQHCNKSGTSNSETKWINNLFSASVIEGKQDI